MTGNTLDFNTYSPGEAGREEFDSDPAGQLEISPDSPLFHIVGDQRYGLVALAAGQLQLMHPVIGGTIVQGSNFFEDPWDRVFRSIPDIIGSTCAPDAVATAERVRKRHNKIGWTDEEGEYHPALEPETFWAAHATFTYAVFKVDERFPNHQHRPDSPEHLYAETVAWFGRYGMDMSPVPRDYESFLKKWRWLCSEVFQRTPAADEAIDIAANRRIPRPPNITPKQWKYGEVPIKELVSLSALGYIPADVRERLHVPFSTADSAKLRIAEMALRQGFRVLDEKQRYFPIAIAGMEAAEQRQPLAA